MAIALMFFLTVNLLSYTYVHLKIEDIRSDSRYKRRFTRYNYRHQSVTTRLHKPLI